MSSAILVMYSNLEPTPGHVERLRAMAPGRRVIVAGSEADALDAAPGCEVFLGHRYFRQCLPRARHLRWVQSTAAGVDGLVNRELLERDVIVSRNPTSSKAVAHHALAMAWALMRRIPDAARSQPERAWSWQRPFAPMPRRALILGMGAIGLELARLLRGLGIHVTGVCRRATAEREAAGDALVTDARWREAVHDADLVFLVLPRTSATLDFLDAGAIDLLPDHAVIVDVARSGTMDVRHAIRRLAEGRLLGLGLDVADVGDFGPSCDWEMPGLLVTPKVASFRNERQAELEGYVEEQLAIYLRRRTPMHVVSREDLAEMLIS